jgi:hypothetical protein
MHHAGITVRYLEESPPWHLLIFGAQREFVAEGSDPELSMTVGITGADLRFAFRLCEKRAIAAAEA